MPQLLTGLAPPTIRASQARSRVLHNGLAPDRPKGEEAVTVSSNRLSLALVPFHAVLQSNLSRCGYVSVTCQRVPWSLLPRVSVPGSHETASYSCRIGRIFHVHLC
jgi:hypothetical protein